MVFGLDPDIVRCVLNVLCGAYNGFNVCHLNAGSLRSKYTVLYQMLTTSKLDVVMVTETWLNCNILSNLVHLPGFKLFRNDRADRIGGGVCMYVREHIAARCVYTSTRSVIQFMCVEVNSGVEKCLLIVVYSPPYKFREDNLEELEETLLKLNPRYNKILVGGDFNVNHLKNKSVNRLFHYFCEKINMSIINTRWPTCFQSVNNPSILDIFLTSSGLDLLGYDQVRPTSEFIHDFIFCSFRFDINASNNEKIIRYRSFHNIDLTDLQRNGGNSSWNQIYFTPDINTKILLFNTLLNNLYDHHVPLVTKIVKPRCCPWYSNGLKLQILERERFYRRYKRNPSEYNRRQYTFARNKVTLLVRASKRSYLLKKLDPKLSSKELWKNLKEVGVAGDKNLSKCSFSPEEMTSVLAPPSSSQTNFQTFSADSNNHESFSFDCIGEDEVQNAIRSTKSNAIGLDGISPKFLKLILPILLPYITHIVNACIYSSQFPEYWKAARIIPIPKKSNPSSPSEFRPISLLPFLAKIFEKLICNQIQNYLDASNMISKWQSGFRNKHSCESAVIKVTSDMRKALDCDKICIMVLLDFSKAFDCIDHTILLEKLRNNFYFSNTALKLILNYLKNRVQVVETEQGNSNPLIVNSGVPQGSVLGPLLFSLFINDLPGKVVNSQMHMYADDVLIYLSRPIGLMEDCVARLNEDLLNIHQWSNLNKMKLNPRKSVGMICSRSEVHLQDYPPLVINGDIIPYVEKVKYLGFSINSAINCCDAISATIRKIYSGLRSLRSSSHLLLPTMKSRLVKSLILPYFTFNCSVYPCLDYECTRKINVAFNDCIRFIHSIPRHISVSHLNASLFGINLCKYYDFRNILKLHSIIHNKCPDYLNEELQFAQSPRGLKLIMPRFSHTVAERSYFVNAIRLWNGLPYELQRTSSSAVFQRKLFSLMSNQN